MPPVDGQSSRSRFRRRKTSPMVHSSCVDLQHQLMGRSDAETTEAHDGHSVGQADLFTHPGLCQCRLGRLCGICSPDHVNSHVSVAMDSGASIACTGESTGAPGGCESVWGGSEVGAMDAQADVGVAQPAEAGVGKGVLPRNWPQSSNPGLVVMRVGCGRCSVRP